MQRCRSACGILPLERHPLAQHALKRHLLAQYALEHPLERLCHEYAAGGKVSWVELAEVHVGPELGHGDECVCVCVRVLCVCVRVHS